MDQPIEQILDVYGSLAAAAIQAGVPYQNPDRDPDGFAAGGSDLEWREDVVSKVHALSKGFESVPTLDDARPHMRMRTERVLEAFGSWQAVLRESGIDPRTHEDRYTVQDCCEAIREAAIALGAIPSPRLVGYQTEFPAEHFTTWFDDWATAVEAAVGTARDLLEFVATVFPGHRDLLDPKLAARTTNETVRNSRVHLGGYEIPSPKTELGFVIEDLAIELGHRPNPSEIKHYLPYPRTIFSKVFGSVEDALAYADVPDERDLTPAGSLNRQPKAIGADEIPSHTDLLRDLHLVHVRGQSTIEEDYQSRGVLDGEHYVHQFGSFDDAVEFYRGLDARTFKERRDLDTELFIQSVIDDLAEVLDRPPLLEEVAALSEYTLDEVLETVHLESEHERFLQETTWSTPDLLENLTAVGQTVGAPPTPIDYRELGDYPVESYLRRFGSWSAALAAVDVDISPDIPEEYHAVELTRETWQRTDQLVQAGIGSSPALKDDLHRLAIEIGDAPTREECATYGTYSPEVFDRNDDWSATLGWAGLSMEASREPYSISRDDVETALRMVAEEKPNEILPADVALFSPYAIQTIIGEYGSLEAAFSAANLSTFQFAIPVTAVQDAWDTRHWNLLELLDGLRALDASLDHPIRYRDVRTADGLSTSGIYKYFRNLDDAKRAAGVEDSDTGQGGVDVDASEIGRTPDLRGSILGELAGEFDR